jgi:hypothetical protein
MAITAMLATTLPPMMPAFGPRPPEDVYWEEEEVVALEEVGFGEVPVELVVLEINAPGPISGLSKRYKCEGAEESRKRGILPPTSIDLTESQESSTWVCR